jgi:hypothetical protein
MNHGALILFVDHVSKLFRVFELHVGHFHWCLLTCIVLDYVLLNRLGQDNGSRESLILPYQRVGSKLWIFFCGATNGQPSLDFLDWPLNYSMWNLITHFYSKDPNYTCFHNRWGNTYNAKGNMLYGPCDVLGFKFFCKFSNKVKSKLVVADEFLCSSKVEHGIVKEGC